MSASAVRPIGSEPWQCSTVKNIKLSQAIIARSEKGVSNSKSLDALPTLRDAITEANNERMHSYMRDTRVVAERLRESLLETNEEIKALSRCKESLEKALEHKRKDIALNQQSLFLRQTRPPREKQEPDGADDLLSAERVHLLTLKKRLESCLHKVLQQLHSLAGIRSQLCATIQERSRVLDLICHSRSSVSLTGSKEQCGNASQRRPLTPMPNPLKSFTPAAAAVLNQASTARQQSATLRGEAISAIEHTDRLQRASHMSVNEGLTQKLAETITLKQHLKLGIGDAKMATHRAQRWYDTQCLARGYALGPKSKGSITTREKLDRPMVQIFQRHPGSDLTEAKQLIKAAYGLDNSIANTKQNIGLLKLTRERLEEDVRNKKAAAVIDGKIVRLRRCRADHRWVMGPTVC
jgi:hypothetical protein